MAYEMCDTKYGAKSPIYGISSTPDYRTPYATHRACEDSQVDALSFLYLAELEKCKAQVPMYLAAPVQ
jgi:hypothetical protein